jgi:hypothetical protein
MELLEISDTHLTKYAISYDPISMKAFLESVINDYGTSSNLQEKAKSKDELSLRYDECRNLKVVKVIEDNSKIHQGRKRLTRKSHSIKYLYSFTAVTYPEIYHAINNFLKTTKADFRMFDKFFNPINYVNYDYHLESLYNSLNPMNDLRMLFDNYEQVNLQNDEYIRKLKDQANCLQQFYKLLTFTIINEREVSNYESLRVIRRMYDEFKMVSTMCDINTYLDPTNKLLYDHLDNLPTHKEIVLAEENYEILEKIKGLSKQVVKHL